MTKGQNLNPEVMAVILADADILGVKAAAERHNVGRSTIFLWRKRALDDPALKRLWTVQKSRLVDSYLTETKEHFSALLAKSRSLICDLTVDQFYQLQGAIKISGELISELTIAERIAQKHEPSPEITVEVPALRELTQGTS